MDVQQPGEDEVLARAVQFGLHDDRLNYNDLVITALMTGRHRWMTEGRLSVALRRESEDDATMSDAIDECLVRLEHLARRELLLQYLISKRLDRVPTSGMAKQWAEQFGNMKPCLKAVA